MPNNEYPISSDDHRIAERLREVYSLLVDETENPQVIHNFTLNKQLSFSLDLLEFIQGSDEYNSAQQFISDNF